jgi:molybdate transport system substrate-binding protein
MRVRLLLAVATVLAAFGSATVWAQPVHVAVAANFAAPMKRLAADFEQGSGHKLLLSFGATGKFVAQIRNGAPFDVLLAADSASVQQLAQEQLVLAGTPFTYASGRLMLWSAQGALVDAKGEVLKRQGSRRMVPPRCRP